MKVAAVAWDRQVGWSADLPELDSAATLVVVFGDRDVENDVGPLHDLVAAFPTSVVVGCSTSGEIAGACLRDGSYSVGVVRFERTRIAKASIEVCCSADSRAAGLTLGSALAADDLRSVFVLSDGLVVNGSDLVAGLVAAMGPDVVLTGGLAGDGDRFERTWVIDDGAIHSGRIVAVGLYGEHVQVGSGSQGGWGIFGPERVVTRSEGNVLYELDGKPALELYKRYLGDLADELPASALLFPLAIRSHAQGEQLVRTVLAIDEAEQSMTFAGDVPQGGRAQLMRSNADRLVDGAAAAGSDTRMGNDSGAPVFGVAISCVGRRLVLGERTEEEIEATLAELPDGSTMIGFYSYGEIAPSVGGPCDLHNQTMTITTFSEV